jgi:signal transduction histidine kinase
LQTPSSLKGFQVISLFNPTNKLNNQMETQSRILVVDDNVDLCTNIKDILDINGYLVDYVVNGKEAISICQKTQYDIALVDINLNDIQGTEVVEKIAKISPSTDFIYITGYASLDSAIAAVKREHVVSYETKPLDFDRLLLIIKQVIQRQQAEKALAEERLLLTQRVAERTADLNKTNLELARAVRLKDEFLATMSHELRSPLQAVLGLTEVLLSGTDGPLNETQKKYLQIIDESGQHLLSLIKDILDLSKIGAGKMELNQEIVDIKEICQISLQFIQQSAQKKHLKVTSTLDYTMSHQLNADPRRLKQILVNLLSNALKFTPEGGSIGLEVEIDKAEQVIHFIVWDTGIGIATENMERLFQPFVQVDTRLARSYEGAGLGLTLVRHLTELHGGSVSVESTLGEGSRFTISLPWQEAAEEQQEEMLPSPEPSVQNSTVSPLILLVEDNENSLQTISSYLEINHYRVLAARDGSEAIIRVQETPPDLIIMDIQMPVMDGLEATQRIRALKNFNTIPIIALTAIAMPGDRERCLAVGATEYLSKPIRLKTLLEIIQSLLKHS